MTASALSLSKSLALEGHWAVQVQVMSKTLAVRDQVHLRWRGWVTEDLQFAGLKLEGGHPGGYRQV